MMHQKRREFPEAVIVVHPECTEAVVNLSDAVGSTSFIVNYVKDASKESTIIIGTEINLIKRLKIEYPDKNIMSLHDSLCPNMYKINLQNLLWTLENLGRTNIVTVEKEIAKDAMKALNNMLSLSAEQLK